jgi:predicted outer membrane repeat protein
MSRLNHLRSRRLAVIGSAVALGSGVASVGLLSAAAPAGAAPVIVHCATDNLQTAIDDAQAGSTINVSGTCTGNFSIDKDLTLQGPATLDGNNSGLVLRVFVTSFQETVNLNNVTIQHGSAGGLAIGGANVNVNSSRVRDNTSPTRGAGIRRENGPFGVGIVSVTASRVSDNSSADKGGGISSVGSTTLNSSSVFNNTAGSNGGGIFNDAGVTTLNSSLVLKNTAGSDGGGIFNDAGGFTTLNSSGVFNNTADIDGGGIFNNGGNVNLQASSVKGNHPDNCAPPNSVPGCSG